MAPTRWGIASTGMIAFDFTNALTLLPPDDHKVAAVAARAADSAEKFAKQFDIPKAYGSYKELADDPDIDIVYVGTITPTHFDTCKLMIEAGKNVLCEKPMTMNADQAKIILDMAKKKNVFFMESLWSRFFPAYHKLREALAAKVIGDITVIRVSFGVDILDKRRISNKEMGDGATYALASYPVQLANLVFGEFPVRTVSSGITTDTGIDAASFTTLHYSNNRVAEFSCHAKVFLSNVAELYGTQGTIKIPDFWAPPSITIGDETHEFPIPTATTAMNLPNSEGFVYEAEAVRQCLLKGQTESPLMTQDESLSIMSVLSEILNQMGVSYDA